MEKQELVQKQAALEAVTMKFVDSKTLVDDVAEQVYEKVCEVVTDTVRQKKQHQSNYKPKRRELYPLQDL